MKTTLKIIIFTFFFIVAAAGSVYLGFTYVNRRYAHEEHYPEPDIIISNDNQDVEIITLPNEGVRITANTRLIYEYQYEEDSIIDRTEEDAPYFLINKTEEDIRELYNDWDVLKFTEGEVVLRRTIEGMSRQYFYIGVMDGYIAVFYQNPINGSNLKEITSTPYSILPLQEQYKLLKGVEVAGEENLIRMLEDYTS